MCDQVSEVVHELSPSELVKLLMAVWNTLIKFPPQVFSYVCNRALTCRDVLLHSKPQ